MATDLERAFTALTNKRVLYDQYFQYYDGDQPVTYTANRLKEIFKGIDAVFTENWCAVVIDSVRDRVNLDHIQTPKATVAKWAELWEESQLKLESDDVHESALVVGEAYVIAWPDEEGMAQAYYNDPRMCHIFYQADNPRVKEYAAKWWRTETTVRMTLYYVDRLEYYEAASKDGQVSTANSFQRMGEGSAVNPYGEIPVFHFRTAGRAVKSDLKSVVPVQNGINKLLADMMVAAEFGAFKQRYVISNADVKGKLKNAPNEVWDLPAGDGMGQQTQAGQFEATALKNYLDAIDNLSMAVSSITRTPKHYFFSIGSNLSGEALIAMEAPLNKKAQDRIDRFIPAWQEVTRFMLKIAGFEVETREIIPAFDRPESVQPFTEAQAIQMYTASGIPLASAARRMGWSEEAIASLEREIQAKAAAEQRTLAQTLIDAQRRFDSGQGVRGGQQSGGQQAAGGQGGQGDAVTD